jgi:hypothetical protein
MLIRSCSKRFIFAVLFLMATPALSVSGLVGLGFFPNEKLALILVVVSMYSWRREVRQLRIFGLFCGTILALLLFTQLFAGTNGLIRPSLNSIVVVLSIPFYYSFLSAHSYTVCRFIFYIGVIQLFVSLIQQYLSLTGYHDIASYFNNYPAQTDYRFPVGETGFIYRTSGLFFESSGYALFQWLSIICALKTDVHKYLIGKFTIFLMIFEVFLNGSLTGYLFALAWFGTDYFVRSYQKIRVIKVIMAISVCITFVYLLSVFEYFNFANLGTKLAGQFDFLSDASSSKPSRLKGLVESFVYMLNSDSLLYGIGFSWITPTLDFYSLYFKAFGLIGFSSLLLYVLALIRQAPLNYGVAVILALSVNGHLSTVVNILLLSMPLVFLTMDRGQK